MTKSSPSQRLAISMTRDSGTVVYAEIVHFPDVPVDFIVDHASVHRGLILDVQLRRAVTAVVSVVAAAGLPLLHGTPECIPSSQLALFQGRRPLSIKSFVNGAHNRTISTHHS